MSLPNQPLWACPEWGPEHAWHECEECLEQFELFIEKAQGGWEDEPIEEDEMEHASPAQARADVDL